MILFEIECEKGDQKKGSTLREERGCKGRGTFLGCVRGFGFSDGDGRGMRHV